MVEEVSQSTPVAVSEVWILKSGPILDNSSYTTRFIICVWQRRYSLKVYAYLYESNISVREMVYKTDAKE
jgi:hypothetical protein